VCRRRLTCSITVLGHVKTVVWACLCVMCLSSHSYHSASKAVQLLCVVVRLAD
jgi:hypothetical protein